MELESRHVLNLFKGWTEMDGSSPVSMQTPHLSWLNSFPECCTPSWQCFCSAASQGSPSTLWSLSAYGRGTTPSTSALYRPLKKPPASECRPGATWWATSPACWWPWTPQRGSGSTAWLSKPSGMSWGSCWSDPRHWTGNSQCEHKRLGTPQKVNKCRRKGAWMTSQLSHNFQASQAVHGADYVTSRHF